MSERKDMAEHTWSTGAEGKSAEEETGQGARQGRCKAWWVMKSQSMPWAGEGQCQGALPSLPGAASEPTCSS